MGLGFMECECLTWWIKGKILSMLSRLSDFWVSFFFFIELGSFEDLEGRVVGGLRFYLLC